MNTKFLAVILTACLCITMLVCTAKIQSEISNNLSAIVMNLPSDLRAEIVSNSNQMTDDAIAKAVFKLQKPNNESKKAVAEVGILLKDYESDSKVVLNYGDKRTQLVLKDGIFSAKIERKKNDPVCEKLFLEISDGSEVKNLVLDESDAVTESDGFLEFFEDEHFFMPGVDLDVRYTVETKKDKSFIDFSGEFVVYNDYSFSIKNVYIAYIIDGKEDVSLREDRNEFDEDNIEFVSTPVSCDIPYGEGHKIDVVLTIVQKDGNILEFPIPQEIIDENGDRVSVPESLAPTDAAK